MLSESPMLNKQNATHIANEHEGSEHIVIGSKAPGLLFRQSILEMISFSAVDYQGAEA